MTRRSVINVLRELRAITGATLLAALAWTLVVGASLAWNLWHEEDEHRTLAAIEEQFDIPPDHLARYIADDRHLMGGLGATHGAIWLAGLGMIGFIRSRARCSLASCQRFQARDAATTSVQASAASRVAPVMARSSRRTLVTDRRVKVDLWCCPNGDKPTARPDRRGMVSAFRNSGGRA